MLLAITNPYLSLLPRGNKTPHLRLDNAKIFQFLIEVGGAISLRCWPPDLWKAEGRPREYQWIKIALINRCSGCDEDRND